MQVGMHGNKCTFNSEWVQLSAAANEGEYQHEQL
jgi:hypothetical protein